MAAPEDPAPRERKTRGRLAPRLVVAFVLVVGATLAGGGYLAYLASLAALERELGARLTSVARLAALRIDPVLLYNLPPVEEGGDPAGRAIVEGPLARIRQETGVRDIVVLDPDGLVLVSLAEHANVGQHDPTVALDEEALARVWAGEAETSPLYQGLDGVTYKSGYAPVRDRAGTVRAVARVELPADFAAAMAALGNRFLLIGAFGLAAAVAVGIAASRWIVGPVRKLGRAMAMGGPDGLPSQVVVEGGGELAELGQRFNRMVDALRAKDRELRALYSLERARAERIEGYSTHLLTGIQSGVVGVDLARKVVLWNDAATEILGQRADPAAATPIEEVLPPAHAVRHLIEVCLAEQRRFERAEERLAVGRGGERWVGISAAPVFDRHGALLGAAAIFVDLTRIRELQSQVARRDRLTALGELAAGLAHEIRNPLGAMRGYADLLKRTTLEDEANDLVDRIDEEIAILNRTVVGFLDFARGAKLDKAPTNLADLVDRTADVALEGRESNGIRVERRYDPALPEVSADAMELRKAVLNLVQNALQAMPEGGTLTLATSRDGDRALIEVGDSGAGIPEEHRDKIFNPFFTTKEDGTGLGLPIAHRIVRAHGGDIRVRSAVGRGSIFTVAIPFEEGVK